MNGETTTTKQDSSREIQREALVQESVIVFGPEIHELIGQEKKLNERYSAVLQILETL